MYQLRISKRYGHLFEVIVMNNDIYGEEMVFPQYGIPVVFRTDAVARSVGKAILSYFEEGNGSVSLMTIDGVSCASLPNSVLSMVISNWVAQGISMGDVKIEETASENFTTADCGHILEAIYAQAVG